MLAHMSRKHLSKEAARPDHNLRRLVGHANMLDNLMLDLANAEEEQESWFNDSVKTANKTSEEPKHIQWVETVPEEVFEEEDEEDSDNESDSDDEQYETPSSTPISNLAQTSTSAGLVDEDEEMEDDDDYEDDLALTRTSSEHPPELTHEDADSDSDDDSMPPSPTEIPLPFNAVSEKQRQAIATSSFYQSDKSIPESEQMSIDHNYYRPERQTAIAAY